MTAKSSGKSTLILIHSPAIVVASMRAKEAHRPPALPGKERGGGPGAFLAFTGPIGRVTELQVRCQWDFATPGVAGRCSAVPLLSPAVLCVAVAQPGDALLCRCCAWPCVAVAGPCFAMPLLRPAAHGSAVAAHYIARRRRGQALLCCAVAQPGNAKHRRCCALPCVAVAVLRGARLRRCCALPCHAVAWLGVARLSRGCASRCFASPLLRTAPPLLCDAGPCRCCAVSRLSSKTK